MATKLSALGRGKHRGAQGIQGVQGESIQGSMGEGQLRGVNNKVAIGVILTSPNGTQYRLIVDDSGNLSATAV